MEANANGCPQGLGPNRWIARYLQQPLFFLGFVIFYCTNFCARYNRHCYSFSPVRASNTAGQIFVRHRAATRFRLRSGYNVTTEPTSINRRSNSATSSPGFPGSGRFVILLIGGDTVSHRAGKLFKNKREFYLG
jgi:hypothetical protein